MIITLIKQVIASATWKDKKKNPFTILFICGEGKVASKGWLNSWRRGGLKLKTEQMGLSSTQGDRFTVWNVKYQKS